MTALWIGFNIFVLLMLALDLGIFHRHAHIVTFKEAISWTAVWFTLAAFFGAGVWMFSGQTKGMEFITG